MGCTGNRALLAAPTLLPQTQALYITAPSIEGCVQTVSLEAIPPTPSSLVSSPQGPQRSQCSPIPGHFGEASWEGPPKADPSAVI